MGVMLDPLANPNPTEEELARAAGTTPSRVMLTSVHQHDAPVADLAAEKLLRDAKAGASVCDIEFHARAVERKKPGRPKARKKFQFSKR